MENNILDRLISIKDSLPNKQRQLCDFMLENHKDIGLYTVKELAENADVGTTTVMRLVKLLGYDSFFDLKKDFHEVQKSYSNKWEDVQRTFSKKHEDNDFKTLTDVWEEGIQLLNRSLTPELYENFQKAMNLIEKAERINLLGLRPYKAVAIYLELLIEEFYSKTRQLSHDPESMLDRILQFEKDEVLIIFSFDLYTQRSIDAAKVAYSRGVPIILVTDELSCPIAKYATVTLTLDLGNQHFTIIPIIALVEAFVIELGKRKSDTSVKNIKNLVKTLKEMNFIVDKDYKLY